MKLPLLLAALSLASICSTSAVAGPGTTGGSVAAKALSFTENRGQIHDQYNNARSDIQFQLPAVGGLTVFVGSGFLEYQFCKTTSQKQDIHADLMHEIPFPKSKQDMYHMDVKLLGANKDATLIVADQQDYFENYYTAAAGPNGVTVHTYNKVTYQNIYPNIDWVLYTSNGKLKHEFVVHAGGNPRDIQLQYSGAVSLKISADGTLTAGTPQGAITEQAPISFNNGKMVKSHYVLHENVISYETADFSGELVIDPLLIWSTYYGGSGEDYSNAVTTDAAANVYMAGRTSSTSSIATTGAFQSVSDGSYDAFLAKFDSAGHRLWTTYYGDNGDDGAYGVAADPWGNVYISGATGSPTGMATPGSYQPFNGGGYFDAFLAKFTSAGSRRWATYHGLYDNDFGYGVATDILGDVYMIECNKDEATSTSSFSMLIKFDSGGNYHWYMEPAHRSFSYVSAWGYGVAADPAGNAYVTGFTDEPYNLSTPGVFQATKDASYDVFIAKIDSAGNKIWGSYFGGGFNDYGYSIALDNAGGIFVAGYRFNTSTFQNDGFLVKVNNAGTDKLWEAGVIDKATGVATDAVGNAYLAWGSGGSNVNIYNISGGMDYSVPFGPGSGGEAIHGVAVDAARNFYMTGITQSTTGIATAGALQTSFGGGSLDGYLAKFNQCVIPGAGSIGGANSFCLGDSTLLTATVPGGSWSSANTAIATVSGGWVKGVSAGVVVISYTVSNACASATTTASVTVDNGSACHVAVDEVSNVPSQLQILPNPTNGKFAIIYNSDRQEPVKVVITNTLGQVVRELNTFSNQTTPVDLQAILGIYLVSVSGSQGRVVSRMIVE